MLLLFRHSDWIICFLSRKSWIISFFYLYWDREDRKTFPLIILVILLRMLTWYFFPFRVFLSHHVNGKVEIHLKRRYLEKIKRNEISLKPTYQISSHHIFSTTNWNCARVAWLLCCYHQGSHRYISKWKVHSSLS